MNLIVAAMFLAICAIVLTTGLGLLCSLAWHFFMLALHHRPLTTDH